MLHNVKAVLFDLDGTLVDSMWMWEAIDIEYLGALGYELPDDLQQTLEGMSYTEAAVYFKETFQIPESLDEIKEIWTQMAMHKYTHEVHYKPGALNFLKELRRRGIKTGICTSNGRELVDAVMNALDMNPYIDCVMTACQVAKGKPSPDIYLAVAENLEASPAECLVFEDIPKGIQAGLHAGMKVCAMEDLSALPQKEHIRQLADYYITSFDQVLNNTYECLKYGDKR